MKDDEEEDMSDIGEEKEENLNKGSLIHKAYHNCIPPQLSEPDNVVECLRLFDQIDLSEITFPQIFG